MSITNVNFVSLQGISVDLSTLRAEWESRSAAASSGSSLNGQLNGSFCQLSSLNDGSSVSGSGNDANEEIDVVGGLDSCSESGSERVDSAADGSVDGECYPRLSSEQSEASRHQAKPGADHAHHNPNSGLGGGNHNLELNHQQGIRHWGLTLLERRRELDSPTIRRSADHHNHHNHHNRPPIGHSVDGATNDDEVQSSSIDLSVKGREERRRLNPFSIDSLLGNDTRTTTSSRDFHCNHQNSHSHRQINQNRASTPSTLSNGRQSTSPVAPSSPISPISPISPGPRTTTAKKSCRDEISR